MVEYLSSHLCIKPILADSKVDRAAPWTSDLQASLLVFEEAAAVPTHFRSYLQEVTPAVFVVHIHFYMFILDYQAHFTVYVTTEWPSFNKNNLLSFFHR